MLSILNVELFGGVLFDRNFEAEASRGDWSSKSLKEGEEGEEYEGEEYDIMSRDWIGLGRIVFFLQIKIFL